MEWVVVPTRTRFARVTGLAWPFWEKATVMLRPTVTLAGAEVSWGWGPWLR